MPPNDARLLLVDDDPSAIRLMSRMLADYPAQRFATRGEDALRLAREELPDLILLDAEMPGMNGFELCEALKSDPQLGRVPVIFATAHDGAAHELAALRGGAADFVTKPLKRDQLRARVRAQLRSHAPLAEVDATVPAELAAPVRLLVVDDNPVAVRLLHRALVSVGEFHFALEGAQALEIAERLRPDIVLLDAQMPGMDGYAVCAALKRMPAFRHVPVVFVTHHGEVANEKRALELGAADFVTKPYTSAVLQARVRNLVQLKRRIDVELRQAREHSQRLADAHVAAIVGTVADAILTCDAERAIVLANAAACRLFGRSEAALVGCALEDLIGQGWSAPPADGEPLRRLRLGQGEQAFVAEVSVSTVGEGEEQLTTLVLRDASVRERLEAEARARAAAESASRTKTQMLSYFAHEIGNPLNAILGFAQLIASDTAHPLEPEQMVRLGHVQASGERLRSMLREVLDFGRFEAGRLVLQPVALDAAAALREALASVAAEAEQAGIVLSLDERLDVPPALPPVRADASRLQQCLVNLLGNAIKYSHRGGRVQAGLSALDDGRQLAFVVADQGLGMTAEQMAQLFEPFNRLGRGSETLGTGLGLAITRQLVTAMEGELRVQSVAGRGSRFELLLPCAEEGRSP